MHIIITVHNISQIMVVMAWIQIEIDSELMHGHKCLE